MPAIAQVAKRFSRSGSVQEMVIRNTLLLFPGPHNKLCLYTIRNFLLQPVSAAMRPAQASAKGGGAPLDVPTTTSFTEAPGMEERQRGYQQPLYMCCRNAFRNQLETFLLLEESHAKNFCPQMFYLYEGKCTLKHAQLIQCLQETITKRFPHNGSSLCLLSVLDMEQVSTT